MAPIDGARVGDHPLVKRLMSGVFNERPSRRANPALWNPLKVLSIFQHWPVSRDESWWGFGKHFHSSDLNNFSWDFLNFVFNYMRVITLHYVRSRHRSAKQTIHVSTRETMEKRKKNALFLSSCSQPGPMRSLSTCLLS
jgi:hypothetical protein